MDIRIKLPRLLGVSADIQLSWLLIPWLLFFSLAHHWRVAVLHWDELTVWLCAASAGVLFLVCLVFHEYVEAFLVTVRSRPVRALRLFAGGQTSALDKQTSDVNTEWRSGLCGVLTFVSLAVLCWAQAWLAGWRFGVEPQRPAQAVLAWLGYANLGAALFSLLPVPGLDGGRLLRAVLWRRMRERRATRLVVWIGALLALITISIGILRFFNGFALQSLWLVFLGWFLLANSLARTTLSPEIRADLREVQVADVMATDPPTVEHPILLQDFVDDYLLRHARRCFVVLEKGGVAGIITPREVRAVPREQWRQVTVGEAMTKQSELQHIAASASLAEALERIGSADINQLPVIEAGHLVGLISRDHLLRWLSLRAELNL